MVRARKSITSRFKPTDLFERRLVITVPRSAIIIITLGVAVGLDKSLTTGVAIASVIAAVAATVTTIEARHQLRTFRYEAVTRLNSVMASYQIPDDDIRIAHELGLIDDDDESESDGPFVRFRASRQR